MGDRAEGRDRKVGLDMYTLLYLEWITNKDLLYSTWNSVQCYVAASCVALKPRAGVEPSQAGAEPRVAEPSGR